MRESKGTGEGGGRPYFQASRLTLAVSMGMVKISAVVAAKAEQRKLFHSGSGAALLFEGGDLVFDARCGGGRKTVSI